MVTPDTKMLKWADRGLFSGVKWPISPLARAAIIHSPNLFPLVLHSTLWFSRWILHMSNHGMELIYDRWIGFFTYSHLSSFQSARYIRYHYPYKKAFSVNIKVQRFIYLTNTFNQQVDPVTMKHLPSGKRWNKIRRKDPPPWDFVGNPHCFYGCFP